ncbi:MAG: hypothetical protein RR538_08845 [Erysipelotrichaceae bacterium]
MEKIYKIIITTLTLSFLISGCSNRDQVNKVLKNNEGVPSKVEERTIKWYQSRNDISKQIIKACDSDTSRYSQRDDCQNAKGAEYIKLIQSDKDLSSDIRLNEDRKYLQEVKESRKE